MSTPREYRMTARATSAADTRRRILRAMIDAAHERLTIEIHLDDVAARAGVSVQTVLRHFGSRDALLDAAITTGAAEVAEERAVQPGDVNTGFRLLLDHYEARGDFMTRMVAQEATDPRIARFTADGRRYHRLWVKQLFADDLAPLGRAEATELTDLLVVATDLATWRVLRREIGLDRAATEHRMRRIAAAVLHDHSPVPHHSPDSKEP